LGQSLGQKDPLEKGMAMHSSILAWRIPWIEEPGRLQSMGCKELDTTERLSVTLKGLIYQWIIKKNLLNIKSQWTHKPFL